MIRFNFKKLNGSLSKDLVTMGFFLMLGQLVVTGQPFRIFAVSEMVRVFEDGFNLKQKSDTLSLFGLKGETVSGQIVVNAVKGLEKLTVETGTLINSSDRSVFPRDATGWNFIGSVFIPKNASNQPDNILITKSTWKVSRLSDGRKTTRSG